MPRAGSPHGKPVLQTALGPQGVQSARNLQWRALPDIALEDFAVIADRWFVSLSKAISMPALRRKVAARRRRPERVLGVLGQLLLFRSASPSSSVRAPRRSEAVPIHVVRVAMSARTVLATGSASMTPATVSSRLLEYAVQNVPAGQIAVSQAVAHSAKSAIRGNSSRRVSGKRLRDR